MIHQTFISLITARDINGNCFLDVVSPELLSQLVEGKPQGSMKQIGIKGNLNLLQYLKEAKHQIV